jgi:hypothetical protein
MGLQVKLPMVVEVDNCEAEDLVNRSTAKIAALATNQPESNFCGSPTIALQ